MGLPLTPRGIEAAAAGVEVSTVVPGGLRASGVVVDVISVPGIIVSSAHSSSKSLSASYKNYIYWIFSILSAKR